MISLGAMFDLDQNFTYYCRRLEENGFRHIYVIDSHVEWREASPYLTLGVLNTTTATIGTCVTNPVSRHPTVVASLFATLQELSGGRMILGIGKGDSSLRRLGERPARLKEFKDKARLIQKLANGEEVKYIPQAPAQERWHAQAADAVTLKLKWAPNKKVPLYIAGYSPRVLQFAGEIADGVFLQIADLSTIEWAMAHIRAGAERARRSLRDIEIVCCTATAVSDDLHAACEAVRGFPAFVMNHVLDMLNYYKASELPANLLRNIEQKTTYDYGEHAQSGARHSAFVSEMADSFTIIGSPARCAAKLKALEQLGVNQVCLYLFGLDRPAFVATVEQYARQMMPMTTSSRARKNE